MITVTWFNHASFRVASDKVVFYIDPWKIATEPKDANAVLISHSHYDHFSPDDIAKVLAPGGLVLGPEDVRARLTGSRAVAPGEQVQVGTARVRGVAAYNIDKKFHPRGNNWLGWIIELDGKRVYYAGDTDLTPEMSGLGPIDVAMLPVGGTYTMDPAVAARAVAAIRPKLALPYHWGDIVGTRADTDSFAATVGGTAKVLTQGETLEI
ncbi:MAG: MBL fold metallo-hydrolase [Phycisphaerae bacterium]|nr:MBL fold metallo-hydrolase [Phycisphaerae bacterium]